MRSNKEINKKDLDNLIAFLKDIPSDLSKNNEMGGYTSLVLVCIDAVLSINRQYYKFVVPRVKKFQEEYSQITTLEKLNDIIIKEGNDGFSDYWNYKHESRFNTLSLLVNKFVDIAKDMEDLDELSALKQWGRTVNAYDFKSFNVSGIGLATFQYLRMLLGANTVKPDIHIKRAVSTAIGKKVNDMETIVLFEKACKSLNVLATSIDHNLWLSLAKDVDKNYLWKDGMWVES